MSQSNVTKLDWEAYCQDRREQVYESLMQQHRRECDDEHCELCNQ